jgi:hypothetical protein
MKEKITQFYDKYKKYLIFAVAVLLLLIWFIHTPKKKVEPPIAPTKTESISNIVSDTNLTKYIISQNEVKSLKSQIKSLNLKLETYQLENIQLKSQFKKTKNDEKNIKYFDYNSSIDSVLRSITRVTTKKPLPNRQQK